MPNGLGWPNAAKHVAESSDVDMELLFALGEAAGKVNKTQLPPEMAPIIYQTKLHA